MHGTNRPGFTLIELMITLVIASFLVVTLTTVLQQSSRARVFVETRVKDGFFVGTLAQELTYDFSGMAIQYDTEEEPEKKEQQTPPVPPILVGRGADNVIQELRFFSVNAREYKKHHVPTEVIYTFVLSDKTKKTYTMTRQLKKQESSKRPEFEAPPVALLDNITKCIVQFIKQGTTDKTNKQDEVPFTVFDDWPLKQQKEDEQKQPAEKKPQRAEFEEISYIRITITYIKNERGMIESITLLIPVFFNKRPEIPEVQEKPAEKEQPKKVAKKNVIEESNKEELVLLEDRTNSMLKLLFKGPK